MKAPIPVEPVAGLAARKIAALRLARVLDGANFVPLATDDLADSRDRAFANRLINLALRNHGHLSHIIALLLERGLPKKAPLFEPVLRLALAELLYSGGADHAALKLAGDIIKTDPSTRHLQPLLNGVLRNAQRRRDDFLALEASLLFPSFLVEGWAKSFGVGATDDFAKALRADPALDLSLAKPDPAHVLSLGGEMITEVTCRILQRDVSVEKLPYYAEGLWWVQDVAAALPARLMSLEKGARILDMCAAPGGKTAQLASAGYEVTALEIDSTRIPRLAGNLSRLGLKPTVICADALKYVPDNKFDGVLLDAPCSATGAFRRHPEIVWHRTAPDIAARAKLQKQMIEAAIGMLRLDGIFIYATCSLESAEGEDQAQWIETTLAERVRPAPFTAEELGALAPCLDRNGNIRTRPGLDPSGPASGQMDGFFVARYRRC